jgi:hypothetical protein
MVIKRRRRSVIGAERVGRNARGVERRSSLVWLPEEKLSVAVLMNLSDASDDHVNDVANAIARSLFVRK